MSDDQNPIDPAREKQMRADIERSTKRSKEYFEGQQQKREERKAETEQTKQREQVAGKQEQEHMKEKEKQEKEWTKKEKARKKELEEDQKRRDRELKHQQELKEQSQKVQKEHEKYMKDLNEMGRIKYEMERRKSMEHQRQVQARHDIGEWLVMERTRIEEEARKEILAAESAEQEQKLALKQKIGQKLHEAEKQTHGLQADAEGQLRQTAMNADSFKREKQTEISHMKKMPLEAIHKFNADTSVHARDMMRNAEQELSKKKLEAENQLRTKKAAIEAEGRAENAKIEADTRKKKAEIDLTKRQKLHEADREASRRRVEAGL